MSPPDQTLNVLFDGAAANAQGVNFHTVVRRELQLTQLRALPEAELKDAYSTCSHHAMERALGAGEAAACSMVYETLLKAVFGGDFEALLLWSRNHPTR
jgi:O-glycosyl hydrolase